MISRFVQSGYFSNFHTIHTGRLCAGLDGIEPNFLEEVVAIEIDYRCVPVDVHFLSFAGLTDSAVNHFGWVLRKKNKVASSMEHCIILYEPQKLEKKCPHITSIGFITEESWNPEIRYNNPPLYDGSHICSGLPLPT